MIDEDITLLLCGALFGVSTANAWMNGWDPWLTVCGSIIFGSLCSQLSSPWLTRVD